ncbi:GNAT family N-acetyltransferase [Hyalangium versicolor]|uniref:GNAT family N-acetyltransferase n=1 Tax=Hyalangium versicolor TaxID=2861190 RepID=UPI001CCFC545|nr:GNAT family N-acetyltransferase [Hyalangium versicolor]
MTMKPLRAVLVPDEGKLALSQDYFRSEHHLRAEGVTHTLVIEDSQARALRIPLIVRAIEGTSYRDAVSPYGFPGGVLDGLSEVPKHLVDWRATELISIFIRDRIGGPCCFADATVRNEVCLIDSAQPVKFRRDHAADIRRNARLGYVTTCCHASQASREDREQLKEVYRQTMIRTEATARYFFSDAWFEEAFSSPAAWLVTTRAADGSVASSAIAVLSDGYLHNYIGGTADPHLTRSPAKNDLPVMVELSARLSAPVHLGGGVRPGDGVEMFKRGFANTISRFYTHEIICEPAAYERLSASCATTDYFPAYRAPRS